MLQSPDEITVIGETDYRDMRKTFGIRQADRRSHMYLIGKTGTGKSTLMGNLVRQDLEAGRGLALFDPHGDLVEEVLTRVPDERSGDLIYFNVPDDRHPLGFNPLEGVPPSKRPLAASGMLEVFKKIWHDSWGPRLEHILRNALLALLDQPVATLADALRLCDDAEYRRHAALRVHNTQVRDFWLREYEHYPERLRGEAIAPLQNKVGAFLAHPRLRSILTQSSSFDLREVMDKGQILLVNLAKGRLGEDSSALLGSLLVTYIGLAALSRAEVPEEDRRDFYLYLDEFQTVTTNALAGMLAELRKYGVSIILANQYLSQLDLTVRDAILGNVGTLIAFRVGPEDARVLEREFAPELSTTDLTRLPNYHIYLKLMIDGTVSVPFSARTFGLLEGPDS